MLRCWMKVGEKKGFSPVVHVHTHIGTHRRCVYVCVSVCPQCKVDSTVKIVTQVRNF